MCINKKVVAGLVVAAVAVYLLAPNAFAPVLPVLVFLACPLSMLLMMRMMSRSGRAGPDTASSSAQSDDELAQLRAEVEAAPSCGESFCPCRFGTSASAVMSLCGAREARTSRPPRSPAGDLDPQSL